MGNCRGCVHLRGHKDVWFKGKDVAMFRCGYAEEEFGGERWVADTAKCEVFKSVIPEKGPIEFLRDCNACSGSGKTSMFSKEYECYGCSGTGKVELFPKDDK